MFAEKARCEGLELELLETTGQLEVAMMEISSLQQKSSGLEEECLERNKMAKEWYDALQASVTRARVVTTTYGHTLALLVRRLKV